MTVWAALGAGSLALWLAVVLAPWRPWSTRERLESVSGASSLDDLTVIVPARNEAGVLRQCLLALLAQGPGLRIVVVDDQSGDGTAAVAASLPRVRVISGMPHPGGWTGKVWAMEQGLAQVDTRYTALVDADIVAQPGLLAALRAKMVSERLQLASLMVELPMAGFWERLLMPAFIYFFKLLYPFALSNRATPRWIAAAAGGCVVLDTAVLRSIGGFAAIRGAIIDDCALAAAIKRRGHRIWIGLTRSARSIRAPGGLAGIWNAVARFAFVQLGYSRLLLAVASAALAGAFVLPGVALAAPDPQAQALGLAAMAAMAASYLPTLRYYGIRAPWALALPVAGVLYLAMTWTSAWRHWSGAGVRWKDRRYGVDSECGA